MIDVSEKGTSAESDDEYFLVADPLCRILILSPLGPAQPAERRFLKVEGGVKANLKGPSSATRTIPFLECLLESGKCFIED